MFTNLRSKVINKISAENLRRRYICLSTKKSSEVVITGAVRTPILESYCEKDSLDLASQCIDEVVKRAAIPRDDISKVHLLGLKEETNELKNMCKQLEKNVQLETYNNTFMSLMNIIQTIQTEKPQTAIICSIGTNIPSNITKTIQYALKNENLCFDFEIMPVNRRQNRNFLTITKDQIPIRNNKYILAASVAITSLENAKKLNIKPLICLHKFSNDIENIGDFLKSHDCQAKNYWEFSEATDVNQNHKCKSANYGEDAAFYLLENYQNAFIPFLTNLTHELKREEKACIGISDKDKLNAILLKKSDNGFDTSRNLPTLTLYTKNICPLCDDLIEELEQNFKDEYRLEKVYIDRKENIRFLRLYRYDIPVLFLNGQFVCMHRLNKTILRKMLANLRQH